MAVHGRTGTSQESFNGELRNELLNGELFETAIEAQMITDRWRQEYNMQRPHSDLGCNPPAPEPILSLERIQLALEEEIAIFEVGT